MDEIDPEIAALERQLADTRARAEAKEAERARARRKEELRRELAEAALDELKQRLIDEHGGEGRDIAFYTTPGGDLIALRRGERAPFQQWSRSKKTDVDDEKLVRSCRVHPATDAELRDLLGVYQGALLPLTMMAIELYGFKLREDRGK